jgi:pilus assembly protein CpaF
VAELLGTGPLEELLGEEGVREISVPRHDRIFVERDGQVSLADKWFSSPEAVQKVVERLAGGSHLARNGLLETRLADGTMLTAAVPPLSGKGATVTLRRPHREAMTLADLVSRGMLSQAMADVLGNAVADRRNVLVSGVPGSGRTWLVAALANAATDGERVISVEESEELLLRQSHWVQLTTRGGAREAIAAALRLRPERLVVGDLRGAEARDVLEAAAGQPGVIAAVFGTSAADAALRIEAMALLGGGVDARALHDAVARSVHIVAQVARGADGVRRVVQLAENANGEMTDLFAYQPADGRFASTGRA